MRKIAIVLTLFICVLVPAVAQIPGFEGAGQLDEIAEGAVGVQDRLAIAISSPIYPVTPGDTYELRFTTGGVPTQTIVTVESDGTLPLNIFGEIETTGLTYTDVKREVEATVRQAYPQSLPFFQLVSVGLFEVTIRGAIGSTTRVAAWGLSRLSDMIDPLIQPYSSTRRVQVRSRDGSVATYDVFRSTLLGDDTQDTYLRPGDEIIIQPIGDLVTISGEVNRPGQYEITNGTTLDDLLEYAGGMSPEAKREDVRITRVQNRVASRRVYDVDRDGASVALRDGDRVFVPTVVDELPVVFIEGALESTQEPDPTTQTIEVREQDFQDVETGYLRLAEFYYDGIMLSDVLTVLQNQIASFADLGRASVIRAETNEVIEVDAAQILYDYGDAEDIELEPYDTIFLPSRLISVLVTGPVAVPGLYLYVPGQPPEYYIRRAGGYEREISRTGDYTVYDSEGERRDDVEYILPGDRIEVERNNFVYQFNRHFPVIVSGLTFITTVVSVFAIVNQ
jgi:hypothetical protein